MKVHWLKSILTLLTLGIVFGLAPNVPIDPWGLFIPRKAVAMIFALAAIQIAGSVIIQIFGAKAGGILSGFLGGLISSTATTLSLARKSQLSKSSDHPIESLILYSATLAMLCEGVVMVFIGSNHAQMSLLLIFLAPMLVTLAKIWHRSKVMVGISLPADTRRFEIGALVKLAGFILLVLALSKILQRSFGQSGILVLTFLVSLFEVHGSLIASVQMFETGAVDSQQLTSLCAVAVISSIVSKMLLVVVLGHRSFARRVVRYSVLMIVATALSWAVAHRL